MGSELLANKEADCDVAIPTNPLYGPQVSIMECSKCGTKERIEHPRGTDIAIKHYCGKGSSQDYINALHAENRVHHLAAIVSRLEAGKLARRIGSQRRVIKRLKWLLESAENRNTSSSDNAE